MASGNVAAPSARRGAAAFARATPAVEVEDREPDASDACRVLDLSEARGVLRELQPPMPTAP